MWKINNQRQMSSKIEMCISGLLRYKVDFQSLQLDEFDEGEFDLDDY